MAGFFVATAPDMSVTQLFLLDPSVSMAFLNISVAPQQLSDTCESYFDEVCHFFLPHALFLLLSVAAMMAGFYPDL
jgi:hypothetical protein